MFDRHFHMSALPFTEHIPVNRIHRDERFTQALARLHYFVTNGTLALITGITGTGKSTLVKLFLSSLPHNIAGSYLHITQLRASSFLKLVALSIGLQPAFTKEKVFQQILDKVRSSDLTYILLVDESQLLSQQVLTDLRLLVSSALDDFPALKIVLVGQPSLKTKLEHPNLADLWHRISIRYSLKPFTKQQTQQYLDSQFQSVGANPSIFATEVADLIFDYSHGIPRQINQIATANLISAATKNLQKVDLNLFSQTMNDFHLQ